MSHRQQIQFCRYVRKLFPKHFRSVIVVDIGSKNINGSNRRFFRNADYTGIDLSEGKGVDIIGRGHDVLPLINEIICRKVQNRNRIKTDCDKERFIDTMISTEALEHDESWILTLSSMYHFLRPGGLLLITAAGDGRPEHGTKRCTPQDSPDTHDYYKNVSNEMLSCILKPSMFESYFLRQHKENNDLQFYGIKKK